MAWLIVTEDSAEGPAIRADRAVMDAHWAYEQSIAGKVLAAGSLRDDEGKTPRGSLLILDVATRAEALAILEADPATKAGLRGKVTITRWNVAILDRRVLG